MFAVDFQLPEGVHIRRQKCLPGNLSLALTGFQHKNQWENETSLSVNRDRVNANTKSKKL